nr:MAG: major capsid protein [Army ant associated microvirus 12]
MKRSKFSLSNYKLASIDMGVLTPIGWYEVLPGDTIQHSTSALVRAAPLVSPVMHPLHVRIHHFFVPNRLIWNEWEDFITGGPNGTSTPAHPYITTSGATLGTLGDYLGVPVSVNTNSQISALPYRAYQLIWNQYYRDEDLQTPATFSTNSGSDATTSINLQNVAWEKDYFTSARPWTQKGNAVTVPIGTSAPVTRVSNAPNSILGYQLGNNTVIADNQNVTARPSIATSFTAGTIGLTNTGTQAFSGMTLDPRGSLIADLSNASAVSVNQLRLALALQRYEEARARYGSRYTEYLRYLGVRSSDARLQRPEYLGGGKETIQFSEVLQTAVTGTVTATNAVGALKGHGISAMRSNRYRRFFEEHGIVMSLMSVRPKTVYMNGIFKKFNRLTKEDYWQKELEHIGQQAVTNREIYALSTTPTGTFGYQDRYDEYRREESTVAGEFRSTLNYWHMARDLGSAPTLNSAFVSCVPTLRTFASSETDPIYVMARHSIQARRQLSRNANPQTF